MMPPGLGESSQFLNEIARYLRRGVHAARQQIESLPKALKAA